MPGKTNTGATASISNSPTNFSGGCWHCVGFDKRIELDQWHELRLGVCVRTLGTSTTVLYDGTFDQIYYC